ncbi:MAG: arylesterase [Bdellovibrionaceae bacterium]|nr:arylesterase [Pseudobdellovibrionaceae bacterium]
MLSFVIQIFICDPCFSQNKLIVLGDSLTEGYGVSKDSAFPTILEEKLKASGKNWTVINAGVTGSTTASAVSRLKWLLRAKPDAVLVILGGNDGLRGIKVPESQKNLSAAIELIQKEKKKVILGGLYMPPNYGLEYTAQFRKMYADLAKKYSVPLIPFILDKVAGDPNYNQSDGIHPNEKGHKIIAETIFSSLKEYL